MNYEIITTNDAQDDLRETLIYISINLSSPKAASAFFKLINQTYERLSKNPYMYEPFEVDGKKDEFRKIPIKNYILVYEVDETQKHVNILRLFYGAMDYKQHI